MVVYKPMNYRNSNNTSNNSNIIDDDTIIDNNDDSNIIDNIDNDNTDDDIIDDNIDNDNEGDCNCYHHSHGHHHCPCPCPKPDEVNITISVDEGPCDINTDVIYGPPGKPGKDAKINGYNEVEIVGGSNIDVVTTENVITINAIPTYSPTYIDEINANPCECDCDCGCECPTCSEFEQVKPSSMWHIEHNLNKYPSVTVVEYDTKRVIECEVKYLSLNDLNLYFNGRFRGWAYLN